MINFKALSAGLAVVALAGCINSSGRPGPFVDVDAPAPFLAAQGRYPTQGQAQAAVDAAVRQQGMESVYRSFGTVAPGRVPTMLRCLPASPVYTGRSSTSWNRAEASSIAMSTSWTSVMRCLAARP
jgi:hypothetical protein